MYKKVHATAAEYFSRYERMGPDYISKNLLHIMSLLLPMRRICSGGALTASDLTVSEPIISAAEMSNADANAAAAGANNSASAANLKVDESLVAPADEECAICMDAYEEPAVTTCNHWYCKACIINVLQVQSRCPLCRGPQRISQLRCGITAAEAEERTAAENEENGDEAPASQAAAAADRLAEREAAIVSTANGVISESKLAALLKSLRAMRRADPTAKALIFSQYNSTIEWLKGRLTREGFGHRHISGSMPLKQRAKAIQAFQGDPPTTVFLLSMRSGAVGINLTAASHVFLLEPALNPALEDQAVGRAWRMGQRREVKVLRFYVKGSVEEQIMEVVKIRQNGIAGASAANAINGIDEDDYRRRNNRSAIRVEDQAGSIKEDKQNLRMSELQKLFKAPEFSAPREDEPLSDEDDDAHMAEARQRNTTRGAGYPYLALHRGNMMQQQQQQQRQQMVDDSNGAGTSAMHAAMGAGNGGGAKVIKNRMRRSKAGIASVAAAAGAGAGAATATATPGGAVNGSNGLTAANGVTPAGNLQAVPATAAPPPATAAQADPEDEEEEEEEEEEVIEMAPAAILQRIKLLAQRATGRLTPAAPGGSLGAATTATTQRAAAAAASKRANAELADQPDTDDDLDDEELEKMLEDSPERKVKRGRGRPPVTADAITAHIPNPTPDATAGGSDSGMNGRPARRAMRPNYAVLANQGADGAGA
jgi:hypothetical protein